MMRALALPAVLAIAACSGGGEVEEAQIDAAANEISADTEALVVTRIAEADARGNEASAAIAE